VIFLRLAYSIPLTSLLTDAQHRSYNIPFLRNRRFIGRTSTLEELEQKLFVDQDTQQVALVGLGGIGKTQTALEFAYRVKEGWTDYSIFWIPALSMESMEQSYSDIARILKIPQSTDDDDVKEVVKQYLSTDTAGKWLLVVDNADDANILFGNGQQAHGIIEYLPQSETGLILFTSRHQEVATKLAGSDVIELDEMDNQEAVSFFKNSLASNSVAQKQLFNNTADVTELLKELAYLPLAIAQAAAFLSQNKNLSIAGYLQLLQGTEQGLIHLLSHEFRDITRYRDSTRYQDRNTENAVAKTWLVSFNQILEHDEAAAGLLSFISCIESKAIPRSILPWVESEEQMVQAIGTLCGYSFLVGRGNQEIYDTHRLVHLAIRKWTEDNGSLSTTVEKAIEHVSIVFPQVKFENHTICRDYLTHALRLLEGEGLKDTAARYELCLKVGHYLYYEGRIGESVKWLEKSCRWRDEHLAEGHPGRLTAQCELAKAYRANGQITKAIKLMEHVVAVETQSLAEENHNRLASQHQLAIAYQFDGQTKKAIELIEHVVAVEARILAEEDPDRLASQHVLAMVYQSDGQITKAIELIEHVVAIECRIFAEEHPSRLASEHVLAAAYRDNGQTAKSVELMERVVAIEARTLAEENFHRLSSQHELAVGYRANGQITKAIELIEYVVSIEARILAEEDPSRLASQHELALAYHADGQITKAIDLIKPVIAIRARILAEDHPDRVVSQRALEIFQAELLDNHLTISESPRSSIQQSRKVGLRHHRISRWLRRLRSKY
jgi:tetratricopeptide (TPR) repeat protein